MKKTLEKLWNEYFAEECGMIDTEEEKALAKRALELHRTANELPTKMLLRIILKHCAICRSLL